MAWDISAPANTGSEILTENGKVRDNWSVLHTTVNADHYGMSAPPNANDGQHKQVTLLELTSAPSTAGADIGAIYTAEHPTLAYTDPYFRREGDGLVVPMTPIRMYVSFAGATGTVLQNDGNDMAFNTTNAKVKRNSEGIYTIEFSTAFPSGWAAYNYQVMVSFERTSGLTSANIVYLISDRTKDSFKLQCGRSGSFFDPPVVNLTVLL